AWAPVRIVHQYATLFGIFHATHLVKDSTSLSNLYPICNSPSFCVHPTYGRNHAAIPRSVTRGAHHHRSPAVHRKTPADRPGYQAGHYGCRGCVRGHLAAVRSHWRSSVRSSSQVSTPDTYDLPEEPLLAHGTPRA